MKAGQHFRDIGAKVEDICGFWQFDYVGFGFLWEDFFVLDLFQNFDLVFNPPESYIVFGIFLWNHFFDPIKFFLESDAI